MKKLTERYFNEQLEKGFVQNLPCMSVIRDLKANGYNLVPKQHSIFYKIVKI